MLMGTFEQLHAARCMQTGNEDGDQPITSDWVKRLVALMVLTNQDPCTTGCPAFKDGRCPAYQQYHTACVKKTNAIKPVESVAQIAKRLGISKNEVRRRKHKGTM